MDSPSYSILEQIVAASSQAYLLIAADSPGYRIRFANPAYATMSGHGRSELGGAPWAAQFAAAADSDELATLEQAIEENLDVRVTMPLYRADRSVWLCDVELKPLIAANEQLVLVQCRPASEDVSPKVSTKLLQRATGSHRQTSGPASRPEPATGLMPEEQFIRFLARDIGIARRNQSAITLLVFEIDELDVYRQTFGRNAAESCLRMIATQLTGTFGRASDLCVRLPDNIFAVSIQGQSLEEANLLASRVAEKTRNLGLHNPRAQASRYLSVRSGVVEADVENDDAAALLDRARQSLRAGERGEDHRSATS